MRSIFCLGVSVFFGLAGCADLLGLEAWQDPKLSNSGDGDQGGAGGGDAGVDTCSDHLQNGTETGVDCGGDICPRCNIGFGCLVDSDCQTEYCPPVRGYCTIADGRGICDMPDPQNTNCADCTPNGDESDIDCGGSCQPCRANKKCLNDGDCLSGHCLDQRCAAGDIGAECYSKTDCVTASCGNLDCPFAACCK